MIAIGITNGDSWRHINGGTGLVEDASPPEIYPHRLSGAGGLAT
jgi:hypothetical protein